MGDAGGSAPDQFCGPARRCTNRPGKVGWVIAGAISSRRP